MALPSGGSNAPSELLTGEFLLRPILASDAERDYEAVVESREFLRDWEQTGWPGEDFTVEANRQDLVRLEQRHKDGLSFTYTIASPTSNECLGCVYVFPCSASLFTKARISATGAASWSDYELAVYFWVRSSRIADRLDARLLESLDPWLRGQWRVQRHLMLTSERAEQQVALLSSTGRRPQFELAFENKTGKELAFA